jgi:hypothetical protein
MSSQDEQPAGGDGGGGGGGGGGGAEEHRYHSADGGGGEQSGGGDQSGADAGAGGQLNVSSTTAGNMFSTRRPKGFVAGVSSGTKNLCRGIAAGVGCLFAMPVMGARKEGVKGAVGGLVIGAVGCAALVTAGAVTGEVHLGRGVINAPEAMVEFVSNDKVWDLEKREWVTVDLGAALRALPATDDDLISSARKRKLEQEGEAPVAEADRPADAPQHYAVLGVTPAASGSEIKKAYARMALKHHPDKNRDDPDGAANRFKSVNEAYRVLSSDVLRAEFDRTGTVDSKSSELANLGGVQPMQHVIGGEAFLDVFGHLTFAMFHFNTMYAFSAEETAEWNARRPVRCALKLSTLLDDMARASAETDADAAVGDFVARHLEQLEIAALGGHLLRIVGGRYRVVAVRFISIVEHDFLSRASATVNDIAQTATYIRGATSSVVKAVKTAATTKQLTQNDAAPLLLALCESDITGCLDAACRMVLYDHDVSKEQRVLRGKMLLRLGAAMEVSAVRLAATEAQTPVDAPLM